MNDPTRIYISSRNRDLVKLSILRQPTLDEIVQRPVPVEVPGQLSLFDPDALKRERALGGWWGVDGPGAHPEPGQVEAYMRKQGW